MLSLDGNFGKLVFEQNESRTFAWEKQSLKIRWLE